MTKRKSTNNDIQNIHIRYSKTNQIKSKSKVLFKVGTFTNSTNIRSHELFKPTCILRYKLQHNKTMSCIKTTYQPKIRCKHIYDFWAPTVSAHVASASLHTDCHRTRKQHWNRCWQLQHILYISKIHNQICHCPK